MFLGTHRFALLLVAALVMVAPAKAENPKKPVPVKTVVVVSKAGITKAEQSGKVIAPREPTRKPLRRSGGTMMERY
jgi:hypothetical protein